MRVEHEYKRGGAWVYIAALDVHHARLFGRCESKNGIAPFDRLVEQVMTRVGFSGLWTTVPRIAAPGPWSACKPAIPRLVLVHAPVHASWLNQVEIYFSIVQRKILTPNDFPDLHSLAERLVDFQCYGEATARPFEWKFTRQDLMELMNRLGQAESNGRRVA